VPSLPGVPADRTPAPGPVDAVLLAGGSARRLGGADKPGLEVGGATLLDRVLAAVDGAERVVVVGPERAVARPVRWTREQPPGGGPAAAVAAGLAEVTAPSVLVLAADLPLLDRAAVDRLRRSAAGRDGALLVDDAGRRQLLAGCWATAALRSAVDRLRAERGGLDGCPVRTLLDGLDAVEEPPDGGAPVWLDCDTLEDLRRARELA
jgi:molybdopterin-guanine dinucleotide biosynthesis protein A